MLERLQDLPTGIDGIKATGTISREDYEHVMDPLIDAALREGRRLRLLYQLAPEFRGVTSGAAWEDAKVGLRALRLFDGCAVVGDVAWIREATRLAAFIMPCPVKEFSNQQFGSAVDWLRGLPEAAAVEQRLIPESGVLVLDVKHPLRAQDFDAVALTVDSWIEAHGRLNGLVIHVRAFPGWENLGALFRHLRFVRDHHKTITHVAVAGDGTIATVAPRIGEHFIHAQVKGFPYDGLEQAIAWAGGGA